MNNSTIKYLCIFIALISCMYTSGNATDLPGIIEVQPSWNIYQNSPDAKNTRVYVEYYDVLQKHLLTILSQNNFKAIPALYSSAFQCGYGPRSIEQIESLLSYEVKNPYKSLTLIPVITKSEIFEVSNVYSIEINIEIFAKDNAKLGAKLFSDEFIVNGKYSNLAQKYNDLPSQFEKIFNSLKASKQWSALYKYIQENTNLDNHHVPFANIDFPAGQTIHQFGQSDQYYYNGSPQRPDWTSFRIHKSNTQVVKANQNTNRLTFEFDIAIEFPNVEFAYLILPNGRVVQIGQNDIHIQQAPGALPNASFTGMRYLVINLPELTDRAIATYAIKFSSRAVYDTSFYQIIRKAPPTPLAKDFPVSFSCDTIPTQLRVWGPTTNSYDFATDPLKLFGPIDFNAVIEKIKANEKAKLKPKKQHLANSKKITQPLHAKANNAKIVRKRKNELTQSMEMTVIDIESKPLPFYTMEPYAYVEPPIIRTAYETSWDTLYGTLRDTLMSICQSNISRRLCNTKPLTKSDTLESIYKIHKFISDSLQYMHVAFNDHRMVPNHPDSTLRNRSGDCKDFSVLLISQLRAIGIEAVPVLVNNAWPTSIDMNLLSYDAFNHMVVYIPHHNIWVDPTTTALRLGITPEHLIDFGALVLFDDSITTKQITASNDSMYRIEICYDYTPNGTDLIGRTELHQSYIKTALTTRYFNQLDSLKYDDIFFPAASYAKKHTYIKPQVHLLNVNTKKPIVVVKDFIAKNAIMNVGSQRILSIPDIPLSEFLAMVSLEKRESDLYFPAPLICKIRIKINDEQKPVWDMKTINAYESPYLNIGIQQNSELQFDFNIPKGIITPNDYSILKNAFETYRNIMSTPIAL